MEAKKTQNVSPPAPNLQSTAGADREQEQKVPQLFWFVLAIVRKHAKSDLDSIVHRKPALWHARVRRNEVFLKVCTKLGLQSCEPEP